MSSGSSGRRWRASASSSWRTPGAGRIQLYEIYEDAAAFEFHTTTPHYKAFAAAADGMIEARLVKKLAFVDAALNLQAERKTAAAT